MFSGQRSKEQLYQALLAEKSTLTTYLAEIQKIGMTTTMSAERELELLISYNQSQARLEVVNQTLTNLVQAHPNVVLATLPQGAVTGDHHVASPSTLFYPGPIGTFHPGVNSKESKKPTSGHKRHAPGSRHG